MNLFIAGIQKCGTTSLADWLVSTGLAQLREAGEKEPHLYSQDGIALEGGLVPPGVVLDATVDYALSVDAIARMPGRNTHIILCLRNHFERCYSDYSFLRAVAGRGAAAREVLHALPDELFRASNDSAEADEIALFTAWREQWLKAFPARDADVIDGYIFEQAGNICRQSFKERVEYEIGFFLSRLTFPFFSILSSGFYTNPLRNLLRKFHPQRITLVTVDELSSEEVRRDFVREVFGDGFDDRALPAPREGVNSTRGLSGLGERPDFGDREWDFLRGHFRQDWEHFKQLAERKGVSMRFVSAPQMQRYLNDEEAT